MRGLIIAALAAAAAAADAPVTGPLPSDAARVAAINAVVASTTVEWSAAFASQDRRYAPPRILYLRVPGGHPAHGSGYAPGRGLSVDLGDVEAIEREFGAEASTLIALVVAHEVGHHVQFLNEGGRRGSLGAGREHQADCYAGWWLAHADAMRALNHAGEPYPSVTLDIRIPQLLTLLSGGSHDPNAEFVSASHGSPKDRVAAFERGLTAMAPAECRP